MAAKDLVFRLRRRGDRRRNVEHRVEHAFGRRDAAHDACGRRARTKSRRIDRWPARTAPSRSPTRIRCRRRAPRGATCAGRAARDPIGEDPQAQSAPGLASRRDRPHRGFVGARKRIAAGFRTRPSWRVTLRGAGDRQRRSRPRARIDARTRASRRDTEPQPDRGQRQVRRRSRRSRRAIMSARSSPRWNSATIAVGVNAAARSHQPPFTAAAKLIEPRADGDRQRHDRRGRWMLGQRRRSGRKRDRQTAIQDVTGDHGQQFRRIDAGRRTTPTTSRRSAAQPSRSATRSSGRRP